MASDEESCLPIRDKKRSGETATLEKCNLAASSSTVIAAMRRLFLPGYTQFQQAINMASGGRC
jgi:N-acetylglucosamine-6-phosphate deacetylase